MTIKRCPIFSTRHIPTLLPASGIQRTPHLLHHGLQTAQSHPGHASLSAVTHHPHREELVCVTFFLFGINLLVLVYLLFHIFFLPHRESKKTKYVKIRDVKWISDMFLNSTKCK